MKRIGLNNVNEFIRYELKRKLRDDLRSHRILREGDIECCVYFHLRGFLNSDSNWRIFAHKHDKRTGYYPDLIIYQGNKLVFPVEIKWNREKLSNHDRKKLRKYLSRGTSKGYFLTAGPDADNYRKTNKVDEEKWKLFEVRVGLKFKDGKQSSRYSRWKKQRKPFKS